MESILSEERIRKELFDKLCAEHKDDVIISEWRGRWEYREGLRPYLSRFNRAFDIARFHRTKNERVSPLLIGYEIKGMRKRKVHNTVKFYPPPWLAGWDQIEAYFTQNADYAYLVTVKRRIPSENNDLVKKIRARRCVGLVFVEERNGKLQFKEIVKPSRKNLEANHSLKKVNLVAISLNEKACSSIQRQDWARKGEFVLRL